MLLGGHGQSREHNEVLGAQKNSGPYLSHIPAEDEVISVRFLLGLTLQVPDLKY